MNGAAALSTSLKTFTTQYAFPTRLREELNVYSISIGVWRSRGMARCAAVLAAGQGVRL